MEPELELGNPPIPVQLRRSARARRLSLRVSGLDGRVTLTLPPHVGLGEARRFLSEREAWIRGHRDKVAAPVAITLGCEVPVAGQMRRIVEGRGPGIELQADALLMPPGSTALGPKIETFLKREARGELSAAVAHHAARVQRGFGRISLRDPRSRWGSCSSAGNLMFSWRLILAPSDVLDYVAAHEVAHLVHMDHSPQFWALTGDLCPDWAGHRDWLRKNGAGLHRYRFDI